MTQVSRMEVHELVDTLAAALTDNMNVHYALGYLKCTLAQVINQLPERDREIELRVLRRVLKDELTHQQNREEAA